MSGKDGEQSEKTSGRRWHLPFEQKLKKLQTDLGEEKLKRTNMSAPFPLDVWGRGNIRPAARAGVGTPQRPRMSQASLAFTPWASGFYMPKQMTRSQH